MRARALWTSSIILALSAPGCGLTLDWDPPDPQVDVGEVDAGDGVLDAGTSDDDAGPLDGGSPPECAEDVDCDDGSWCSGEERCVEGACESGAPPCPDASACLLRACDEASASCGDFVSICADSELCTPEGACVPRPTCAVDADCPDDRDPCTGTSVCDSGACVLRAAEPCVGERGCVRSECIPFVGCGEVARHDLCAEADGLACTQPACSADSGACVEAPHDSACTDAFSCTDDLCRPASDARDARGCVFVAQHARCDDGATCTEDTCAPGALRADAAGCVFRPADEVCRATVGADDCGERVCVGARAVSASDDTGCAPRLDSARCAPGETCQIVAGAPTCVSRWSFTCFSDLACDDENPCNGSEGCEAGRCVRRTSTCPDSGCEQGWCDVSSGAPVCALRDTEACFGAL